MDQFALLVAATLNSGTLIAFAALGLLINETQNYLPTSNAWLFWVTLSFIVLISLSVSFMGDGLRDALDPRQNRVRA